MVIKLPPEIAANPRYAALVAMADELFITPKELAARWGVSVARLGQLRAKRKGPAWVKIAGGGVRYRLSDVVAHERAGEGGPLSVDRLRAAIETLPDFDALERATIAVHLLRTLFPPE